MITICFRFVVYLDLHEQEEGQEKENEERKTPDRKLCSKSVLADNTGDPFLISGVKVNQIESYLDLI